MKGWKKIPNQRTGKKAGVPVLTQDKIDFKTKPIERDTEGYFIILKGRIHQEYINTVNIYGHNIGAPKYVRKIFEDFKKEIDNNILALGEFNTPLSKMDRSPKQSINKDMAALNNAPQIKWTSYI